MVTDRRFEALVASAAERFTSGWKDRFVVRPMIEGGTFLADAHPFLRTRAVSDTVESRGGTSS
jgi:hypothetical protein